MTGTHLLRGLFWGSCLLFFVEGCVFAYADVPWTKYVKTSGLPRVEKTPGTYVVRETDEPIRPVRYHGWFVPAEWVVALAQTYLGLDRAFGERAFEYCNAIWYEQSEYLLHASTAVRWADDQRARLTCPDLVITRPGAILVGKSHSHPDRGGLSMDDARQGNAVLQPDIGVVYMYAAVAFGDYGHPLQRKNPFTGELSPLVSQNFLFRKTVAGGRVRVDVFMWVQVEPRPGEVNTIAVFVPSAPGDSRQSALDGGWRFVTNCGVTREDLDNEWHNRMPLARCDNNVWE